LDNDRIESGAADSSAAEEHRLHRRVSLRTPAVVNQPSLWPDPFEVVAENVSLGGALFTSRYLFSSYDYFHCRVMLPGSGPVAGKEVRVSAVVVRVDDGRWKDEGRCGVGAFFVGLDEEEESAILAYISESS
jgi:hypothetical protein